MTTTLAALVTTPTAPPSTSPGPDPELIDDVWFYIGGVATGLVCLLGIVGNLLSLIVWGSRELRTSTCNLYFLALTVYDLVFDVIMIAVMSSSEFVRKFAPENFQLLDARFYDPVTVAFSFLVNVATFGSVYTTLALAVDRCVAVVKPLKWPSRHSYRWTASVQVAVFLWSVLVNVPIALEGGLEWTYVEGLNQTFLMFAESAYRYSSFHTDVYLLYLFPAASFVLPVLSILAANAVLVWTVRGQGGGRGGVLRGSRHCDVSRTRDARRLTVQVVVLSTLTLVSRCLHALQYVWMALLGTIFVDDCSLACNVISTLTALVLVLNASVNLLFYLHYMRRFRALFLRRFSCLASLRRRCCCRDKPVSRHPSVFTVFSTASLRSTCSDGDSESFHSSSVRLRSYSPM